jgi:hypothetical protein
VNHVHLQRFDLEVPVVAAIWTSQRHTRLPLALLGRRSYRLILCNGRARAQ